MNCQEKKKLKTTALIPAQIRKRDFVYTEYPILTKILLKVPVSFPPLLPILKNCCGH